MANLLFSCSLMICLQLLVTVSVQSDDKQLILVHTLYRHGDRSPLYTFPTDPYQESYWPQGFAYLSQLGINQHLKLGQYFRKRYIEGVPYRLISSNFSRYQVISNSKALRESELFGCMTFSTSAYVTIMDDSFEKHLKVYTRSTDSDRTLMSAYSNLAGMFSPSTSGLPWQPIPVHSVDQDKDFMRVETCARGQIYFNSGLQSEEAQRVGTENEEFLEFVADNAGVEKTLFVVGGTQDSLYCERNYGLPLPDWVESVWKDGRTVYDKILELYGLIFNLRVNAPGANRLLGGGILNEIVIRMEEKAKGTVEPKDLKLYAYSTHDTTVGVFMAAMNVFNNIQPPFAAAVMIELFNVSGHFAVEVWYKNDTEHDAYQLVIPGCNSTCPLHQFIDLLKENIMSDWETECQLEDAAAEPLSQPQNMAPVIFGVISCVIVLAIASLLIIIVVLLRTRRTVSHGYQSIDESTSKFHGPTS